MALVLQPVAAVGDLHNVGVMQQPIQQGCGQRYVVGQGAGPLIPCDRRGRQSQTSLGSGDLRLPLVAPILEPVPLGAATLDRGSHGTLLRNPAV